MKHYSDIDTIPIWNYNKWLETEDPRYFLILDYYDQLPDISDKFSHKLTEKAMDIYFEANELEMKLSNRNSYIFDLTKKLVRIEFEHNIINNILQLLDLTGQENAHLLKDYGYSIREGKEFTDELKRIFNQNQNKKVKIKELKAEIEAMNKQDGETQSIESIQVAIEKHNNREINLRTTTLKKWIILKNNLIKDIEKQQLKK